MSEKSTVVISSIETWIDEDMVYTTCLVNNELRLFSWPLAEFGPIQ